MPQDANVEAAVAPFVKGAKNLDLACGTGYYSNTFFEWGAKRVIVADILKALVDAANIASTNLDGLNFLVADCSVPIQHGNGPFEVVLGDWLLNYASCGKEMSSMFRRASVNLTEGGHFIGFAPPPTDDPRGHGERALAARPT